jgi:PAS domain S-box-containing protein
LIVDDEPAPRAYLASLLEQAGYAPLEAMNGGDAVAKAPIAVPDLILAAVAMRDVGGFELVRQLRLDPLTAAAPVIFCSAPHTLREAHDLARRCGALDVLAKPYQPATVIPLIEAALRKSSGAPGGAAAERELLRLVTARLSQKAGHSRENEAALTELLSFTMQLGCELDPQLLLQSFTRAARRIVGARCSIAGIVEPDEARWKWLFRDGMSASEAAELGSPDARAPLLQTVLKEGRPVRLESAGDDARAALGYTPRGMPIDSWLAVPIASRTGIHGFIGLIGKPEGGTFSEADERLAGILSAQVGRVYENGVLYADAIRRAGELQLAIEARGKADREIAGREEYIGLLLNSTSEAIFGVDLKGLCTFANRACVETLGYADSAELVGKNTHALIHHTQRDGAPNPMRSCKVYAAFLGNEAVHVDDEVFWRADGSCFDAEYWAHPMFREGQVLGAVVRFHDITEQRRLEERFRESERHLRNVVESSPAVLFRLAVNETGFGNITWMSDNLAPIFGYPPEAAMAPDWWMNHAHPEDIETILARTHAELMLAGYSEHEYRFRHGDGSYRWTRSVMRLLRDNQGRPLEAVGASTDISEQKRAEEEKTRLREQLLQAQKLESVGRLAAGIAHDFNNLLTVVNGYSDLMLKELPASSALHGMAGEIGIAGHRAAELTRQLLLLSRKQVMQTSDVDLNRVVSEVSKMLRRVIGEDIHLETIMSSNLGLVRTDAGQMQQVLMNLAINARDAMPDGGTLLIETRNLHLDESGVEQFPDLKAGRYVELRVSDTGCGMTKETLDHLFEPFFTTKAVGEGTGLGLATVYGIVKLAGGWIWVYSEPGNGASFKIYLPRAEASEEQAPLEARTPPPLALSGTETILLVEDQEQLLHLVAQLLRDQGYAVLQAGNPAEAIRQCEAHNRPIDLLVSDVILPQMHGPELAKRLRISQPAMKVLFISGYSERVIANLRRGEGSYLAKPFSSFGLLEKVREVLGAARLSTKVLVVDREPAVRRLLRVLLAAEGFQVSEAEMRADALRKIAADDVDLVIADVTVRDEEGDSIIESLRVASSRIKIITLNSRFTGHPIAAPEGAAVQASIAKPIRKYELLGAIAQVMAQE